MCRMKEKRLWNYVQLKSSSQYNQIEINQVECDIQSFEEHTFFTLVTEDPVAFCRRATKLTLRESGSEPAWHGWG